ncbi:MAG: short-chain fatty acid transporter, partial [Acidobacteria bacterium]|nr:short-chain fatty acid transporter [Acidobacteriota bacterium]
DHLWTLGTLSLTIDSVNFLFLFVGILLHPSPRSLLKAAEEGTKFIHGIIVQFPFYAGMYGIIQGTGLSEVVGNWFLRIATPGTYPLILCWYSGVVNYFVPSGGSKWAIEAPYVIHAARLLDVPVNRVVLSYAWGDMLTDLLQPFWCIPLLNAARLEFKDILGFELIAFLAYALLVSAAFSLMALL